MKTFFEAIEFTTDEQRDIRLRQAKAKRVSKNRFTELLEKAEQWRRTDSKQYHRVIGNLLNLYGVNTGVQCMAHPEEANKLITDA